MNENHEQPKVSEVKISATDFFRVVGSRDWKPSLSLGPFLPITSGGNDSLAYKMVDARGSTCVNNSHGFVML